jgi:hypothetical protein
MTESPLKLPSNKEIFNFWQTRLFDADIEIGDLNTCFACGRGGIIHRCHIYPKVHGGPNTVENLHLLCPSCHHETEFMWGGAYWNWLKATNADHYKPALQWSHEKLMRAGINMAEFVVGAVDCDQAKAGEVSVRHAVEKLYKLFEGGLPDPEWVAQFKLSDPITKSE